MISIVRCIPILLILAVEAKEEYTLPPIEHLGGIREGFNMKNTPKLIMPPFEDRVKP